MRTFDFFNLFVTFIWVKPVSPLMHISQVNELDGRCRTSRALFLRFWPLRRAMGVGIWRKTGFTPRQMFLNSFESREVPLTGDLRETVRRVVADNSLDADDEWQILQMLELDQ